MDDRSGTPRGRPRSLPELLIEIARESEKRRTHHRAPPERETRRSGPVVRGMGLGGCLIRAVMLLLFLFLILTGGFLSIFGGY